MYTLTRRPFSIVKVSYYLLPYLSHFSYTTGMVPIHMQGGTAKVKLREPLSESGAIV